MAKFDKSLFLLFNTDFNNESTKNAKKQVWKIRRDRTDHHLEVCKFNGTHCLEFVLDKNIRHFEEVTAVTGWNGQKIFIMYRISLSGNTLSTWDATVAAKYKEATKIHKGSK